MGFFDAGESDMFSLCLENERRETSFLAERSNGSTVTPVVPHRFLGLRQPAGPFDLDTNTCGRRYFIGALCLLDYYAPHLVVLPLSHLERSAFRL